MISLIVLTYRPGGIDLLADMLARTIPSGPWELIVIDDYPGRVERGLAQYHLHERGIPLGYYGGSKNKSYPETKGGLCNATNTALLHAKGDFLVFLSDFTILPPQWLQVWEKHREMMKGKRQMLSGAAIMFDAPKPDLVDDVQTWHELNHLPNSNNPYSMYRFLDGQQIPLQAKWPWVAHDWETFYYGCPLEYWLEMNGLDERADHCHCWPVSSHIAQAKLAGWELGIDPSTSCFMIDHRIWDSAMTEPAPISPFCGMWRIDHSQSVGEEPKWEVPSPNPFNLRICRGEGL